MCEALLHEALLAVARGAHEIGFVAGQKEQYGELARPGSLDTLFSPWSCGSAALAQNGTDPAIGNDAGLDPPDRCQMSIRAGLLRREACKGGGKKFACEFISKRFFGVVVRILQYSRFSGQPTTLEENQRVDSTHGRIPRREPS